MALSIRTLMREKLWAKMIRSLPEGVQQLPQKMTYPDYNSMRIVCFRINKTDQEYNYIPSINKGLVTVTKLRKVPYAEPVGE